MSNVKFIKKILRSLLKRFRIKVTTIEESKDLELMKIEELVGSLQTYEYSQPPVLKHLRKKVESPLMKTPTIKKRMQLLCTPRTSVD